MNKEVSFELAKLLKEKGFDKQTTNFYTKPNSKMFGIDEHYRNYPIKNTPKKLYTVGIHAVLNIENIYYAPTIAEVVMWLYEKYGIWITVTSISQESWQCHMTKKGDSLGKCYLEDFYNPTEAYEAAIEYTLNNLI